jgi:hypothetical protein
MKTSRYWFPAKRYGWGWGPPRTWQGWVTLILYFGVLGAGAFLFLPQNHTVGFVTYSGVITALLVLICYVKGEPPSWRWGR